MNTSYAERIREKFLELFKVNPFLVKSPGRVNFIGEHTDYNMGYVLPGAIDKAIYFAISPRNDRTCKIYAYDKNEEYEFTINKLDHSSIQWPNYIIGVIDQLVKANHKVNGFNCVFGGDIPIGAGLSSSAALEAGLIYALNNLYHLGIDNLSIVKLAQKTENEFVGVMCGIMDQFINIFGKSGHVLKLDCRTLEYEYYPFDYSNVSLVLFDTCISRSLASSEYNKRRRECSEGVNIIQEKYPEVTHLRDVDIQMLNEFRNKMNEVIYKRCKYVVEENTRLLKACEALKRRDLKYFGNLMVETHKGLSTDYEVSCKELDFLVELAKQFSEIYGTRMLGGGFGGCTINLIDNNNQEKICSDIVDAYEKKFGYQPKVYITSINEGTQFI